MNKTASTMLLFLFFSVLMQFNGFSFVQAGVIAQSRVIYVPGNFTTISAAVVNATSGDTIMVMNGTYKEQVVINKPLRVIGENRSNTIIDAGGANYAVQITASNVTLSGFTIRNQTTDPSRGPAALWLNGLSSTVSNVTIVNCTIAKSVYAVWFSLTLNNTFRGNEFTDNSYDFGFFGEIPKYFVQDMDASNKVNGRPVYWLVKQNDFTVPSDAGVVIAVNSTNITVKDVAFSRNGRSVFFANTNGSVVENITVANSLFGIWLEYSFNDTIRDNMVFNSSLGYGISLIESNDNVLYDNIVSRCAWNIKLVTSHQNKIMGNTVTNSTDSDGDGIMLDRGSLYNLVSDNIIRFNQRAGVDLDDQSNWNVIRGNLFEFNTASTGALEFTDGSSYNLVTENTFRQNSYGITSDYSDKSYLHVNNMIYKNNFINNTIQVANLFATYNLFSTWDNSAEGNYWSNFVGIDANLDGVIDAPYNVTAFNTDRYPLLEPWSQNRTYLVTVANRTFAVTMQSNSTIGGFNFNQAQTYIAFNVTGPTGASGFCNVTIPKLLLNVTISSEWAVTIGSNFFPVTPVISENSTHTFFHLEYNFSTHYIRIKGTHAFPEFPLPTVLLLTFFLAALSVAVLRRKRVKGINSYA
jgi:parallel beta-helix repeat protein